MPAGAAAGGRGSLRICRCKIVVWTETVVKGPTQFDGKLAQAPAVQDYYRDIAVLAMPAPTDDTRIQSIRGKASFPDSTFPAATGAVSRRCRPQRSSRATRIVELTEHMNSDGVLTWDVPPGEWLILRLGHTTTGKDNHPAPESGRGLECDKFNPRLRKHISMHWWANSIAENQTLAGPGQSVRVDTHRQLGSRLAELDAAHAGRVSAAARL